MPIINLELVIKDDGERLSGPVVQRVTDMLGDLFGSGPGGTWTAVRYIPIGDYAENQASLPESVQPTFVRVMKFETPPKEQRAVEALEIARVVSECLGRPQENTHVFYEPEGKGRTAFGGVLPH